MLVLSRKVNQSVIIKVGDVRIEVMVTRLQKHADGYWQIQVGFDAPRFVEIVRKEIDVYEQDGNRWETK